MNLEKSLELYVLLVKNLLYVACINELLSLGMILNIILKGYRYYSIFLIII